MLIDAPGTCMNSNTTSGLPRRFSQDDIVRISQLVAVAANAPEAAEGDLFLEFGLQIWAAMLYVQPYSSHISFSQARANNREFTHRATMRLDCRMEACKMRA